MLDRLPGPTVVNRNHPLNRGRISWWLVTPSSSGGARWIDLVGRFHATLTNMTTSASGWRGTTQPGGRGCLLFDGVDDHAIVPGSQARFQLNAAYTIAFWLKTSSASGVVLSGGWDQHAWLISVGIYNVAAKIHCFHFNNSTTNGNSAANDGAWHRWAIVHPTGGPTAFYRDGVADGSSAQADNSAGATNNICIGQLGNSSLWLNGSLNDVPIWDRALTAAEVAEDYRLSRLGYPGVLNRVGWPMVGATTAAFSPAWARGSNRYIGAGVF